MSRSEELAPRPGTVGGIAGEQLQTVIDRIERLELEKKQIADDIADIYAEAKGNGYCTKTIRKIVKLRKMSADERAEEEALLDIYMAALGMLADTPLGNAAIRKLSRPETEEPATTAGEPLFDDDDGEGEPAAPQPSIEDARRMGGQAAGAGKPVTSNPFPAGDPRRAAFDEGWCAHSGTDGMELPESWRRKKTPKKPDADKADDGVGEAA